MERNETRNSPDRVSVMLRALAVVLLAQLVFWLALTGLEVLAQPAQQYLVQKVDLILGDAEGNRQVIADLVLMDEPGFVYSDARRRPESVFVHRFELQEIAHQGVYLSWTRRVLEYRLNGAVLKPELGDEDWGTISGFEPTVVALPQNMLRHGSNVLEIKVSGNRLKILPMFAVGPVSDMFNAHRWGALLTVDLVYVSIGLMLFISLLICFMAGQAEQPQRLWMLVGLMAIWSFRNACFLGLDSYFPRDLFDELHYTTTYVFIAVIMMFTLVWLRYSHRWLGVVSAIWAIALMMVWAPSESRYEEFVRAFTGETLLTVAACALSIALFSWHVAGKRDVSLLEGVLFIFCFSTVGVDALDDRWQLQIPAPVGVYLTFYVAPLGGLVLALGMAATLARQSLQAQKLTRNLNQELEQRLASREQALQQAHAEQEVLLTRQAVLAERQRIVRDMHDGLSGQLTGLIALSGDSQVDRANIADGLRTGLADLRMIVQSLDGADDKLSQALGNFRARIRQQLASQGIDLEWQADPTIGTTVFRPDAVLNVYRFLQEGVHNAVRHAGADRIAVNLSITNGQFVARVEDSGCGLAPVAANDIDGRGLTNLRLRAKRLQGQLEISPHGALGGCSLTLRCPVAANVSER